MQKNVNKMISFGVNPPYGIFSQVRENMDRSIIPYKGGAEDRVDIFQGNSPDMRVLDNIIQIIPAEFKPDRTGIHECDTSND